LHEFVTVYTKLKIENNNTYNRSPHKLPGDAGKFKDPGETID
jgi:hypothetical protein